MVRWFKLFGDQYLGFWLPGLVIFLLQEVPYMVMPLFHPETNPIMQMTETSMTLDLCEKILGSLCIALMVFVVHKDAVLFSADGGRERLFFLLTVILLLTNYFGWALYYAGHQSVLIMMLSISPLMTLITLAAVLCGGQPLETEHTPDSDRNHILRGALHPCAGEPDQMTGYVRGQYLSNTGPAE